VLARKIRCSCRAQLAPPMSPARRENRRPVRRAQAARPSTVPVPPSLPAPAPDRGEVPAFAEIAREYRPRLFALALQLTGNAADAEDVAQDALLRAYQHLPRFEARSGLRTWLYRIAVNRAFSQRQRSARRRTVQLDDDRLRAALAVDARDPQQACELAETYALLLDALDQLSPLLRTTVVLVTLHGLRHDEAAKVLGSSPGTIGFRIHEARKQLRERLDPRSGVRPVRR
jgi:RNA polymerase sigma-70 factor, ECF subfamily